MGQDKVRRRASHFVSGCAQSHLQERAVETDGVHARQRTEVGVQQRPVVEPRGGVPTGEHALRHRVEGRIVSAGADRAGGLALVEAASVGRLVSHVDYLSRLALRSKETDTAPA